MTTENPEIMTIKSDREESSLCTPCFFTKEEIQHVNFAMKIYRKTVDKFPEGYARTHALAVLDAIMKELAEKHEVLSEEENLDIVSTETEQMT